MRLEVKSDGPHKTFSLPISEQIQSFLPVGQMQSIFSQAAIADEIRQALVSGKQ